MARSRAKLQKIHRAHRITKESDGEFLHLLQMALLLALKEMAYLNPMQYRLAEEKLNRQKRECAGKKQEER